MKAQPTEPAPFKRPPDESNGSISVPPAKIRRIQPIKIGEVKQRSRSKDSGSDNDEKDKESDANSSQNSVIMFTTDELETTKKEEAEIKPGPSTSTAQEQPKPPQNEETEELKRFIKACRKAESNDDMKKIIKKKLLKNYHLVAAEFVLSSNFQKLLKDTADDILRDPKRVYSKIQDVVNELEARKLYYKNSQEVVVQQPAAAEKMETDAEAVQVISSQESTTATEENGLEIETTGDKKKDSHLKKLNKALSHLKKKIEDLEEAEVNLDDDDDSAYMQKVRYEKRAMDIYNKICELTGESTHAHRIVKKPVKFRDSKFKEFNRRLTKKINRENGFPSYYDVYRLLDVCNKDYNYRLAKIQLDDIARASFTKVGELLKERRCSDLYESACHWAGKSKDPAKEDPQLKAKLDENREVYRKKTEEVLEHFTKKQYEELKSEQQPGTSKSFAVLKDEEEENDESLLEEINAPNLPPPPSADDEDAGLSMVSLIDVKAEEIAPECKNDDASSASVLQFSILS